MPKIVDYLSEGMTSINHLSPDPGQENCENFFVGTRENRENIMPLILHAFLEPIKNLPPSKDDKFCGCPKY